MAVEKEESPQIQTGQKILDTLGDSLCSLYYRWQEEKEYEDFADYRNVMKKKVEAMPGFAFVSMKRYEFERISESFIALRDLY